jgi:hypothetical protein
MVHPSCFAPKRKIACGATMVWGKAHPYCRYCASPNTYPLEDHVRHQSVKKRTPVFVWNYARNRNVLEAKGDEMYEKSKIYHQAGTFLGRQVIMNSGKG